MIRQYLTSPDKLDEYSILQLKHWRHQVITGKDDIRSTISGLDKELTTEEIHELSSIPLPRRSRSPISVSTSLPSSLTSGPTLQRLSSTETYSQRDSDNISSASFTDPRRCRSPLPHPSHKTTSTDFNFQHCNNNHPALERYISLEPPDSRNVSEEYSRLQSFDFHILNQTVPENSEDVFISSCNFLSRKLDDIAMSDLAPEKKINLMASLCSDDTISRHNSKPLKSPGKLEPVVLKSLDEVENRLDVIDRHPLKNKDRLTLRRNRQQKIEQSGQLLLRDSDEVHQNIEAWIQSTSESSSDDAKHNSSRSRYVHSDHLNYILI